MERNTTFATMVTTGEKPHAEIHAAAFDEGEGYAICAQTGGYMRGQVAMIAALVEKLCKELRENDSDMAAAAFLNILGEAMLEGAGAKVMEMATMMRDPKTIAKAVKEMLEEALEADEEDED